MITERTLSLFKDAICGYYLFQGRLFPWRSTSDPYHILVSEIMLQQTQTERVQGKYEKFIDDFPDISALSHADLSLVLAHWQGLGYNRRALNLKKTAEIVIKTYEGNLPDSFDKLITLPGIGKATAGSILAFAFNKPVPFIETNIRRVFIHFFFQDRQGVKDKDIMPLVEQTLDRENPRQWYYALMDYGAMLAKSISNPNRKSAHYTRQSRFEGSDRQVRGMIIKTIVNNGPVEEKALIKILEKDSELVNRILCDLDKEGFIVREHNMIKFP